LSYAIRRDVIRREQDLFYSTIEAHLEAHPSTMGIHNWLSIHCPTIVSSVKEVICRALQGVRSIARYYPPVPPSNVPAAQSVFMPPRVPLAPTEGMTEVSPNTE
jgi:hypothetical protein